MSHIVGSSKYSPLNNLSVHTLAPIVLPTDCTYTPSWIKQKAEQEEARRLQQQQQKENATKVQPETAAAAAAVVAVKKEPEKSMFEIKKEIKSEPMSPAMNIVGKPNVSMHNLANAKSNENNNTIINKLLSQGPNISSNIYLNSNNNNSNSNNRQPMDSFQNNFNHSSYGNMMASDSMFRKSMGIMSQQPPPPPYDVAIHSPSLNSNLNMANNNNSNNSNTSSSNNSDDLGNNKRISNVKGNSFMRQNSTQMMSGHKIISEANSLLVNVLLYDTSLNIFRDHNFDSCTICVCNETNNGKYVGNIRGTDSGIYLSLSTNCHFNSNLTTIMDKLFESKSNAQITKEQNNRYMGNSRNLINSIANNESPYSISLTTSTTTTTTSSTSSSSLCDIQNTTMPISNGMDIIPSFMNALNTSGYADDDPIFCRCGFSAVINRRLAHMTGLFYEDEMEITGMAKDPALSKKQSLALLLSSKKDQQQQHKDIAENKIKMEEQEKDIIQDLALCNNNNNISLSIFDLVRDQCTLFQNSSNTIQRAIKHLNNDKYSPLIPNRHVNLLEFIDALDIISLALEQSKYAFEKFDGYNNRQSYLAQQQQQQHQKQNEKKSLLLQHAISVHKWPFLNAAGPKSNQDIIRVMKSMKVLLQKAFNQNGTTGLWDAPYAVRGPLTWREFHRLAGRGIGQCEPQPIPSVVVGHDKEWLCVSPYALQFWDKLLLEPYSYPRDIAYIVVTPDNEFISSKVKAFFKELSTTYEMCRLGKHQPVKGWEGILKVGSSKPRQDANKINEDDWLRAIDQSRLNEFLKLYDTAFHQHLVPYLSKIPNDKTLLNPPESFYNYKDHHHHHHHQKSASLPSPMRPPNTPESNSMPSGNLNSSLMCDKGPNTPKSDHDMDTKENSNPSCSDVSNQQSDQLLNPPHIVLYIVEPFTGGTDSSNLERVACLALLKQYSSILNSIPDSVKTNISIQIIAQESILELGKNRDINRWSDHMRNLALSVFTQSYRYLAHTNNVKSLTGFGTAATAEIFLKSKDEKNRTALKLYTPPYILSTRHAKSENSENFGQSGMEQQCQSIMYCCYCLSEDQSMLLGVVTDERGEFIESCAINIDVPNRKRRRKSSARRIGLKKLMDFILGVMSQTVKPWRLVVGRIGRIGHGELKGWSWLLSKPNLVKASKYLKDICMQCSVMYPQAVPSIWSACLVTLEPDSSFRVMPDQFTPDERFSQRSTQSPLSTPQDVTCTHILVFPTSAISQVRFFFCVH
jgi:mediator of RNA polymerase II transcription subunit 13